MEGLQAEFQTLLREHTALKRQVTRLHSMRELIHTNTKAGTISTIRDPLTSYIGGVQVRAAEEGIGFSLSDFEPQEEKPSSRYV